MRVPRGIGPVIQYRLSDGDAQRLVRGLSHTAEVMFAAGARRVLLPIEGVAEPLSADAARSVLRGSVRPGALRLFTVHAMGTARMSSDPARGVVDSFGELHGANGVFVADASVLPGPVGVNPMETIIALATRNAERLVDHRTRYRI